MQPKLKVSKDLIIYKVNTTVEPRLIYKVALQYFKLKTCLIKKINDEQQKEENHIVMVKILKVIFMWA